MLYWVEQCCCIVVYIVLRVGFYCCLEMFVEWNVVGMECFIIVNWVIQCMNMFGVDVDFGMLGNVFNNCVGGGVDGIQVVIVFDQYVGVELMSWGTYVGYDWCWQ